MNSDITHNSTITNVLQLIKDARNAEMFRDVSWLQVFLQPVWINIDESPDYDKYDLPIKAELLRLSGSFLTL